MTTAQFQAYSVIIMGDPSTYTSCSATVPADALSTAATWGSAVSGNVAVLGTAPALGGTTSLISDSIEYAASSGSGKTGLYVSLNCDYSSSSAGTAVPLLASVEGGRFTVTGQGSACPSAAGTINTWQALALPQFRGLTTANLGPWSAPACSVEETFNSWPSGLSGLAYYGGASPKTFTASDGATGQAYILAGAPVSTATAALAPSTGGLVPRFAVTSGINAAAPGVMQPTAGDPVNTENGDFTQTATDVSIPTFGPSLSFTRTYDAQAAQAQAQTGAPGPMGYGWADNWSSSLSAASPVPGDIYTIDGERLADGNGGVPLASPEDAPADVEASGGNIYIADAAGNRVQEIPGATGTQWGISMTAGDIYTIAGSAPGKSGKSGNGTAATASLLNHPESIAIDSSGNVFIADTGNNRVVELVISTGDLQVVAGTGTAGTGGDGIAATSSALDVPVVVRLANHNVYIADTSNNRVQEVAAASGTQWGQSMTAGDVYTVAGSAAGTGGNSGEGALGTSALLSLPEGLAFDSSGNLYIAVTGSNKVQEMPPAATTQFLISMAANHIYTIAGQAGGAAGTAGDGGNGRSAYLDAPSSLSVNNGGRVYIADAGNNRIQELSRGPHSEWGISMLANDIYTIAGQANGIGGSTGDGGLATSATLANPQGVYVPTGTTMYIADAGNNRIRLVNSADTISTYVGNGWNLVTTGDGGPAVNGALNIPEGEVFDANGDVIIADSANNRIQEIAATNHTQWGVAMHAGDVYTISGGPHGAAGKSGDGGSAAAARYNNPMSIAIDAAGNLYIGDTNNCRVQKITASTGIVSTVAGSAAGTCGNSGDGGAATSALLSQTQGIELDTAGDIYIADTFNNQVREVYAAGGQSFGHSMTAGDIYTIVGSTAGTAGTSGNGGAATSALLHYPVALGVDGVGNLYIADWDNNRIQEVPVTTGTQRGQQMTKYDVYTIAGSASGTAGKSGNGGPATSALLSQPGNATVDAVGNVYITDGANNRVQEVPVTNGTQWGQAMTANDIYTVTGSASGSAGDSGDGGPAIAALMNGSENISLDSADDLYVTDGNNRLREVTSATPPTIQPAAGLTSALYPAPGGLTVTESDGSQVTFYAKSGGSCAAPYVAAGQYCTLQQNVSASLSLSGGAYTFTPQPGATYTYNSTGQLTSQTDSAGNKLTVSYGTPAPGSGNCPSSAGSCDTVMSASGRALTIGLNPAGLVTSVSDPMSRTWTYAYNSSNQLTSVTDPMSHITGYTYGQGSTGNPLFSDNLLTITSPNAQPGGPDAGDATVNVYDSEGRVTSQTDPMGFTTTFDYSGMNSSTGDGVVRVADPDGNTTVYDYTQGTVAAQSDWTGSTLTSEKDYGPATTAGGTSGGTLLNAWTADGNAQVTTYTYDSAGNTTSTTDPAGNQTTAWSTSLDDASCNASAEASSNCSSNQQGPAPVAPGGAISPPSSAPLEGQTWTLYDTTGNQLYATTGIYEPGANSASYARTTYQLFKGNTITLNGQDISCNVTPPSASLPCATINADGVVTQLIYDPQGDLTSSSTPDGNGSEQAETTYTYDGDGEQLTKIAPDGNLPGGNSGNYTTTTAYDADGKQISVTVGGGTGHTDTPRTTSYGYDANGNQLSVKDARGYTTASIFNADDKPTLVTDPDGNATLTCYDGDGNTAQTVPAVGVAAQNLTAASCSASYPSGYSVRLAADATVSTFNSTGTETQQTTPAPAGQSGYETTTYAYDGNGNLLTTTAPATANGGSNQITVDRYNSAGQLASHTTGYGTSAASTVSYCYDPNGDKTSVVYADGNTGVTNACSTSSPWTVAARPQADYQTTYTYDSDGELVSTTTPKTAAAPNGGTTTSTYDAAGNMLTRTDPNGIETTWTYTPLNLPAAVSYSGNSAHSVTNGYDADGKNTGVTDATGTSSYVFNSFGELTSAQNGTGQVIGYGYNPDGQVSSITYPLPSTATWATSNIVSYEYDNADHLNSITDFNGHQIAIGDTADGQPNSVTLGSSGDTLTTIYDSNDGPQAISLKNSSTTLQSFTYSGAPAGTILSETDTPSSSLTPALYTYDAQGRITSDTPGTGSANSYGFDASGNLATLPNGAAGTYDNAGELTSQTLAGTSSSYTYDGDGQQLSASQGSTSVSVGTWNGAGELAAYAAAAANMTAASYDGSGRRASTTITPSGQPAVTQGYVWNTIPQVPQLMMDSANAYIEDGAVAPVEQVSLASGNVTYLATDMLGSVRGTVNANGIVTGTTSYDAWGNPQTVGGLTATTPFGFAGGYTDPDGLIYLLNRYYQPATGQFISVDPALPQTLQPYEYGNGDPVAASDPSGLCATVKCYNEQYVDIALFSFSLQAFLNVRRSVCGVNYPVKFGTLQNCWWLDNGHSGNSIVWSSDGCSTPALWQIAPWWAGHAPLYEACELHDFGYRNYWPEGRFTTYNKHRIDNRFFTALNYGVCGTVSNWFYRYECRQIAYDYWVFEYYFGHH